MEDVKQKRQCSNCEAPATSGSYCRSCFAAYQRASRWKPTVTCSKCGQEHDNPKRLDPLAQGIYDRLEAAWRKKVTNFRL